MNSLRSSGPAPLGPSPTTYPENCTNQSADLVEAVSLVICEEITWRPFFFGCRIRVTSGTGFLVVSTCSSVYARASIRKKRLVMFKNFVIEEIVNFRSYPQARRALEGIC